MNNEIFNNLTHEKLYNGANLCITNAEAHFLCSELMAKNGQYGLANSHLILGAEEGIKSILLYAGYFKVEINFSVLPFFKNHKAKHEIGEKSEIPYKSVFLLIKGVKYLISKKSKINFIDILLGAIDLFDNSSEEWWKKANDRKNDGFYVGYNNEWIFPQQITKEEYEISKRRIKGIRDFIELAKMLKVDDYKEVQVSKNNR